MILPVSVSQVARIIGMSHWLLAPVLLKSTVLPKTVFLELSPFITGEKMWISHHHHSGRVNINYVSFYLKEDAIMCANIKQGNKKSLGLQF
jgi:hypothetical protein